MGALWEHLGPFFKKLHGQKGHRQQAIFVNRLVKTKADFIVDTYYDSLKLICGTPSAKVHMQKLGSCDTREAETQAEAQQQTVNQWF